MKPRTRARKDGNHQDIARALVDIGCEVFDTSQTPGLLDMIVAFRGRLTWLEIKTPKTRDDLTEQEQKTIERLQRTGAPVAVVCTVAEAYQSVGAQVQ